MTVSGAAQNAANGDVIIILLGFKNAGAVALSFGYQRNQLIDTPIDIWDTTCEIWPPFDQTPRTSFAQNRTSQLLAAAPNYFDPTGEWFIPSLPIPNNSEDSTPNTYPHASAWRPFRPWAQEYSAEAPNELQIEFKPSWEDQSHKYPGYGRFRPYRPWAQDYADPQLGPFLPISFKLIGTDWAEHMPSFNLFRPFRPWPQDWADWTAQLTQTLTPPPPGGAWQQPPVLPSRQEWPRRRNPGDQVLGRIRPEYMDVQGLLSTTQWHWPGPQFPPPVRDCDPQQPSANLLGFISQFIFADWALPPQLPTAADFWPARREGGTVFQFILSTQLPLALQASPSDRPHRVRLRDMPTTIEPLSETKIDAIGRLFDQPPPGPARSRPVLMQDLAQTAQAFLFQGLRLFEPSPALPDRYPPRIAPDQAKPVELRPYEGLFIFDQQPPAPRYARPQLLQDQAQTARQGVYDGLFVFADPATTPALLQRSLASRIIVVADLSAWQADQAALPTDLSPGTPGTPGTRPGIQIPGPYIVTAQGIYFAGAVVGEVRST